MAGTQAIGESSRPRPLRVAYVTQEDSSDAHAWSGSVHGVLKALRLSGAEVTTISRIGEPPVERYATGLKRLAYARLAHKRYLRGNDVGLVRGIGRKVDRAIGGRAFDVLFFCSSRPTFDTYGELSWQASARQLDVLLRGLVRSADRVH